MATPWHYMHLLVYSFSQLPRHQRQLKSSVEGQKRGEDWEGPQLSLLSEVGLTEVLACHGQQRGVRVGAEEAASSWLANLQKSSYCDTHRPCIATLLLEVATLGSGTDTDPGGV